MEFSAPREPHWPEVLEIASRSVAHLPGAAKQDEWLQNRRTFSQRGDQIHFVALENGRVVGYGAIEGEAPSPTGEYRVFIVVDPDQRDTIGSAIYSRLEELLEDREATGSRFVEYAQDIRFIEFICARGYVESRRFPLASGVEAIVLSKDHR